MNKLLIIFYSIIFCSAVQGFDQVLRPFLYKGQEEPIESIATSQEITQELNKHLKNALLPFKAFDVEDDGINTILVTNDTQSDLFGKLKYIFFPEVQENNGATPSYLYITNIFVAQNLRRKGLGSALFKYVQYKKHPEQISYIQLTPAASDYKHENISHQQARERLILFYQNLGMQLKPTTRGNKLFLYLNEPQK